MRGHPFHDSGPAGRAIRGGLGFGLIPPGPEAPGWIEA